MTGFTKAIFIIHLILGVLGSFGGIMGLVALAVFPAIQAAIENSGQANGAVPTMEVFPGATILAFVVTSIGLVVSILMVWGGIAGLNYKSIGRSLIKNVSIFMVFYKILEIPYSLVVQYHSGLVQKKQFEQNMQANPNAPDVSGFFEVGMYIGYGVTVVFAILMIVFYFLCFLNLNKEEVKVNFR
jgi:hypothetical protein